MTLKIDKVNIVSY